MNPATRSLWLLLVLFCAIIVTASFYIGCHDPGAYPPPPPWAIR